MNGARGVAIFFCNFSRKKILTLMLPISLCIYIILLGNHAIVQAGTAQTASPIKSSPAEKESPCRIPENYSRTRPNPRAGPTEVRVGIYMGNIYKVSETEQTYTADFYVRLLWKDPRLTWGNQESLAQEREAPELLAQDICWLPLDQVWFPPVLVGNQANLKRQYRGWALVSPNGQVEHLQRYYGTLSASYDMRFFPFDSQTLNLIVGSIFADNTIRLKEDQNTSRAEKFSITNWDIKDAKTFIDKRFNPLDRQGHSRFIYQLEIKRKTTYYFWNILVPMGLIVLMAMSVFFISPEHRVAQISLAATSFLSLVAYFIRLSSITPEVDYLTTMTKFSLWCTIVVFLALVETIIVSILAGKESQALAKRVDRISRVIFPILFFGVSVAIFSGIS